MLAHGLHQSTIRYGCMLSGLFLCMGCSFTPDEWAVDIPSIGSSSSPAAADLNDDGVLDLVMGASVREFTVSQLGVFALDGNTGEMLWNHPTHNQMVGSPIFQDVDSDGTPDVCIGGRSGQLLVLNGTTGKPIWEFLPYDESVDYVNDTTVLSFFNPQWVPDLTGDGIQDVVTAFGGYVKAPPGDPNRPAGYVMLIDGATGATLRKMRTPDGRETYMSPVVINAGGKASVIFGTGGEDLPGHLYRISLTALAAGTFDRAEVLLSGGDKGFIAPPIIVDLTDDRVPEIVVCTVDGRLVAIDGRYHRVLWTAQPEGAFDTYVMPAPGHFVGRDDVPDFFASFGRGAWPSTEFTVQVLVDGSTGEIVFVDTLGTFQYASPVVENLDRKSGGDDVLLAINHKSKKDVLGKEMDWYENGIYVYPGGRGEPKLAFALEPGSNLGSTPLITDLDGDGKIDLITAFMSDAQNFYSFKKLRVQRREINVDGPTGKWLNYMGPGSTGVYE